MKQTITLISLFILPQFFLPGSVFAEKSAKRLLFDDCDEAKAALQQIPPDQIEEFISYLGKVLSLPTGSASELLREPELLVVMPTPLQRPAGQPPIDELKGVSISRTLEPERELEAKRCAGKLLLEFGDKALRLLPSLAVLLQDKTLSDEIRSGIALDLRNLVIRSKERNSPALADIAAPLFQLALQASDSEESKEIFEILISMGESIEPYLIDQLFSNEELRSTVADRLLERIDKTDWKYLPAFRSELEHADPKTRNVVLQKMAKWERVPPEVLSDLLLNLLRTGSESSAPTFELIEKILKQEPSALMPEAGFFGVFFGVAIQKRVLTLSFFEPLMRSLEPWFGEGWNEYFNAVQRIQTVSRRILFQALGIADFYQEIDRSILSTGKDLLPELIPVYQIFEQNRSSLFALCVEEIRSLSQSVRMEAFECLGTYPAGIAEVEKALLQFLKSRSEKFSETRRREGVLSVIDVLGRLPLQTLSRAYLPSVQEAMWWEALEDRETFALGKATLGSRPVLGWEELAKFSPENFLTTASKILEAGEKGPVQRVLMFLGTNGAKIPPKSREPLQRLLPQVKAKFEGDSKIEAYVNTLVDSWTATESGKDA